VQELRRNFKLISVLGFTAVLMCTWEAILFTASYILPNGGLAGMVWYAQAVMRDRMQMACSPNGAGCI
jgi:hypothetical protein